jgi:hypothetical protein
MRSSQRLAKRVHARSTALMRATWDTGCVDLAVRTGPLRLPVTLSGAVSFLEMFWERPNQPYNVDDHRSIDADLDQVWFADDWRSRLAPYLATLAAGEDAPRAFETLVAQGCQPDHLAEAVYRSVVPKPIDPIVEEGFKQMDALAKRLRTAATRARELNTFFRREWGELRVPLEWIAELEKRAEELSRHRAWSAREPDQPLPPPPIYAPLVIAARHVQQVTGRTHLEELRVLIDAVRCHVGQKQLGDEESLKRTITRARRRINEGRAYFLRVGKQMAERESAAS